MFSDDTKINYGSEPMVINVSEIKSFRPWNKGPNDVKIKGDMTIIVLNQGREQNTISDKYVEKNIKFRTMLIQESCASFMERLSHKAQVIYIDRN